jgi:hypothetical protein
LRIVSWLSICFIVSNATPDDDEDRHAGEADGDVPDQACDRRQHRDGRQEQRTGKGDPVEHVTEVGLGLTPGTNAGDESALTLDHLGLLHRVELDGGVEVGEEHDQGEQHDHVPDRDLTAGTSTEVDVDPGADLLDDPSVAGNGRHEQRREQHHRGGEDDRDHTGGVDLDRDVGGLAAHHTATPHPLGELDRDATLGLVHVDDRHDHRARRSA